MTQLGVCILSAVMVLGLTVLPGSTLAQQKTLKEQLVGAWTLVSNETTTPDGTKQQANAKPEDRKAAPKRRPLIELPDMPNLKLPIRAGGKNMPAADASSP